jgi:hypothetical protein
MYLQISIVKLKTKRPAPTSGGWPSCLKLLVLAKSTKGKKPATYFFDVTNPHHSISTFSDWKSQDLTGVASLI